MFGFFRETMTCEQTVAKLMDRILSYDPKTRELFADEPVFVAHYAIFFSIKFTRHRTWKRHSGEIIQALSQALLQHFCTDAQFDMILADKISDRIELYSLAITISSDDPSSSNVAREIGITFAELQGEEANEQLIRRGAEIFAKETDAMIGLFKTYNLTAGS
jgi:hypothetical protein